MTVRTTLEDLQSLRAALLVGRTMTTTTVMMEMATVRMMGKM